MNGMQRSRGTWPWVLGGIVSLLLLAGCEPGIPTPRDGNGTGGNSTLFYKAAGRLGTPLWSPDGRWVVAEDITSSGRAILRANGELVTMFSTECDFETMAWLPDGRLSCVSSRTSMPIYRLDQEGIVQLEETLSLAVPNTIAYAVEWHPNRPWLAILANQTPGELKSALYLLDQQGRLLSEPLVLYAHQLAWSPDGKRLAVVIERDRTQEPRSDGDIQLLSIEEGEEGKVTITQEALWKLEPAVSVNDHLIWSPSGRWLVCRKKDYRSEDYLYLLATDGSGKQVKLTSSKVEGQLANPHWSPDGKRLIAERVRDGALVTIDMEALLKRLDVEP